MGSVQSVEGPNRTKKRKREFSFSSWAETSIFSCPWTPSSWFLVFWTWTKLPRASLVLQLADGRPWDFSASIIAWVNSYNKSALTHPYISHWFCLSGERWPIHIPLPRLKHSEATTLNQLALLISCHIHEMEPGEHKHLTKNSSFSMKWHWELARNYSLICVLCFCHWNPRVLAKWNLQNTW